MKSHKNSLKATINELTKRHLTSIMQLTFQKEHQEIIDYKVKVNFSGNNVQVTKFYLVRSKVKKMEL